MVVLHSRGAPLPHICSFQLGLMEEGSNVRLVRCPKCENLLPELPNVAVYQCGGCGAVLQANNRVNSGGGVSEKSELDGFGVSSGKLESFPEEGEGEGEEMSDASEVSDREGNGIRVVGHQRGTDDPTTSSSSRTDTKALVVDENTKYDPRKEKSSIGGNDPTPSMGIASRSRRLGEMASQGVGYRRPARTVAEEVRFPRGTSTYPDEGPSNYQPVKSSQSTVGPDRVEHLEQDREELLRQLEELSLLKAQLSRPNERVPVDAYAGRDAWFPEGSSRQQRPLMQNFPAERLVRTPEPVPAINRHGLDMHNFYASTGYGDPYAPQMLRSSTQYHQHPSHDYFPSHYMGMDASFPTNNTFFHQPACSCAHCYNKRWHSSSQVPPAALHNRRLLDAPANPVVPRGHHRTNTNPLPIRLEPRPRLRMQRSLNTGNTGLGQVRPRTVLAVKRNGRRCYPVAGGAPFVTCPNCHELLPLPRKVLLMTESYRKLRCGACSTILSLMFDNSRIVVSVPAESDGAASTVDDRFIGGVVKESILGFDGQANNRGGIMYSSDGDSSGYNFHLTDAELGSSSMDRRLNLSNSEKLQGLVSSRSTTSDDEVSPDSVREVPNSEELPMKARGTPPVPSSPLGENSSSKQVGSQFEKGNRSKRVNQEESVAAKATCRQNSVKDVVATEMDVSSNEYPNGGMTQDSGDVPKDDRPKGGKGGGDSFFGLIKKSFRNQTGENDRSTVFVNGHPISDRLVRKAEKHSGPIHPGHYWYDFRAGFWGAMGQPCLGIIPPFIEEFKYPIPKNCACGNTGVSVNGRELHHKDLDLLASRGLPRTANKSYMIDISGKVFDEESGEELDNLGKLAPTVEKLKRGFGLRVPKPRVAAA